MKLGEILIAGAKCFTYGDDIRHMLERRIEGTGREVFGGVLEWGELTRSIEGLHGDSVGERGKMTGWFVQMVVVQ
jgi:hypothetical protein